MKKTQIRETVNSWIDFEDIPPRPGLKPIRKYDLYADIDDDEIKPYLEFIRWYLSQEHLLLQIIPKPADPDFWKIELDEFGDDVSAFNTHDFEGRYPFDKYQYKLKKVYEKAKDLAITYSCISDKKGKNNIQQKCKNLIDSEFRNEAIIVVEHYRKYKIWMNKNRTIKRIQELNDKIQKCKNVWYKYANWK